MNDLSPLRDQRIKRRFLNPWENVQNCRLLNVTYTDSARYELLADNNDGIHIISHEAKLSFSNKRSLYISWDWEKNWEQYVLSFSKKTFFHDYPEKFSMSQNDFWMRLINQECIDLTIWGYREYKVTETPNSPFKPEKKHIYSNQPHIVRIKFENDQNVFFANFYYEEDFAPKIPVGDDLWVIFDKNIADEFIDKFKFDIFK
jgi:hypothetical protein